MTRRQPNLATTALARAAGSLGRTKWYFVMHEQRFHIVLRAACQTLEAPPRAQVLEVGVWPGFIALAMQEAGFSVRGIDLEPDRLTALKKLGIPIDGIDLNQAGVLPYENNVYDCVILSEVIEHLNPQALAYLFRELHRVLKPGGRLILTTPNKLQLGNLLRPWQWQANRASGHGHGHWKEYRLPELTQLLQKQGFGIHQAEYCNFYVLVGRNHDGTYYYPLYALWRSTNWFRNALKLLSWPVRQLPACKDSLLVIAQKPKSTE